MNLKQYLGQLQHLLDFRSQQHFLLQGHQYQGRCFSSCFNCVEGVGTDDLNSTRVYRHLFI